MIYLLGDGTVLYQTFQLGAIRDVVHAFRDLFGTPRVVFVVARS